jgi:hypothetical protein
VGDTKAGSKTARTGSGYRRRAVGTRDKIISHLAVVTDVVDNGGMASTRLAEAVDYPGSSVAFAQLLSGMERDGLIAREVRGKRTYRITLTPQGIQRQRATEPDNVAHSGAGRGRARSARADSGRMGGGRASAGRSGAPAGGGAGAVGSADGGRPGSGRPGSGRSGNGRSGGPAGGGPAGGGARLSGAYASADLLPGGAEFDYDELARRLLIQVVRRLSSNPGELTGSPFAADQASFEETVAGLERELATAWTRHGTLTAENMKLRQQLREAQRDLELERRARRRPVTDELNRAEAVLLDRLLSPADEPGANAG